MQYLTSIENTPYMRWQAEILIESFKRINLEDRLVIACAEKENLKLDYKNIFYHENVGEKLNYKCLNRAKALVHAVENKLINFPFASIDPDTFILKELPLPMKDIGVHKTWYMSPDFLEIEDGYLVQNKSKWLGAGCIYIFKNPSLKLFNKIYQEVEQVTKNYILGDGKLKKNESYWQRDMIGYNLALQDEAVEVNDFYEGHLDWSLHPSKKDVCFVHYCNGVLPYFDKHHENPFEQILTIPTATNKIKILQEIVKNLISEQRITCVSK